MAPRLLPKKYAIHMILLPALLIMTACATTGSPGPYELTELPTADNFCLQAQRVVTRTMIPMTLQVHEDLPSFVKSKAVIEGPAIQQFNWYDAEGNIQGYSCKMKSADHLNIEFGPGSAGPDGFCQDMNEQVYKLVLQEIFEPVNKAVVFEGNESGDGPSNMTGPQWLLPYTMAYIDAAGSLHVAASGFVIEFSDPRYQRFPPSWRGTHYCHLIAPEHLAALLRGQATADAVIGRKIPRELMVPVDE